MQRPISSSLLDAALPSFDVNEVHQIWVPAAPETVFAAIREVTAREVRLLLPLMAIRSLPRLATRRRGYRLPRSEPVLDSFLNAGFVLLGERPPAEIAVGGVGRFWSLAGNTPLRIESFATFAKPGYSKAALSFVVRPENGGSRVVTETRVAGTSPDATRAFRRYWIAIRLGTGAIRRSWLAAIRRRALRAAPR